MAILGAELNMRHKAFFRKLSANNVTKKVDNNKRAELCAVAH